jgi:hypothetical protein
MKLSALQLENIVVGLTIDASGKCLCTSCSPNHLVLSLLERASGDAPQPEK